MTRLEPARRAAALLALFMLAAAVAVGITAMFRNPFRLAVGVALILLTVVAAWYAFTARGPARTVGRVVAVVGVLTLVIGGLAFGAHGVAVAMTVALGAASAAAARYALRRDTASLKAAPTPGDPVSAANRGVLIMNLKSGGGKAERFELAEECRRRGIEPVVLSPGDDLLQLAEDAVARGADVIGMAGGDGSQALVASVASSHDVPLVGIPAGTRNHFALDLGLDRDDVVGALDAFGDAVERRIDLAMVGDRVFVNNVSLGVYAKIVQSSEYRDAKRQTAEDMLPDLLGPDAEGFDLRFDGPDGVEVSGSQIVQVSNDPYVLTRLGGSGRVPGSTPAPSGSPRPGSRTPPRPPRWLPSRQPAGSTGSPDGSSGARLGSRCAPTRRSRPAWTERRCSSTRRSSSARCPAPSGSVCPITPPAARPPRNDRGRSAGRCGRWPPRSSGGR